MKKILLLMLATFSFSVYAAPGSPQYKITWQHNGTKINFASVCRNHSKGSIEYRGCRRQANEHFKDQCKKYKKLLSTSSRYNYKKYKKNKGMFCDAADRFNPITL